MSSFDDRARNWDEDPIRVERARAVAGAIARMVPLHDRISCIEYGAGTGLLGFALQPLVGTMLLTDASAAMTEVAGEKIASAELEDKMRVLQLDLLTDPLPGERFDLLITQMTLHHIPDIPAIL
ncbi:MAG TPA: class I SAM-dependent methyltransferase, partial [bacterium]|nr:class I SAM-dependent methyltransferase [bacterium]